MKVIVTGQTSAGIGDRKSSFDFETILHQQPHIIKSISINAFLANSAVNHIVNLNGYLDVSSVFTEVPFFIAYLSGTPNNQRLALNQNFNILPDVKPKTNDVNTLSIEAYFDAALTVACDVFFTIIFEFELINKN